MTKAPRELIRCTFTFVKKISPANKRETRILRQRKMPRLKNRFISNLFILIAFSSPVECSKNVFWCEISQIVCSRCESLEIRLFYRNLSSRSLGNSSERLSNTATIGEINSTGICSFFRTKRETQNYAPLQRRARNSQTNSHNLKKT